MNRPVSSGKKQKPRSLRNLLFIQAYAAKYGVVSYADVAEYIDVKPRTWHRYVSQLRSAGVRLEASRLGNRFEGYRYLGFDPLMAI